MTTVQEKFERHVDALFTAKTIPLERQLHAALGAAGEAGEIADALKKAWVYQRPLDLNNILEECGDTLFYLTALLHECGWTLDAAMQHNLEKLAKRYPNGFNPADAIARADKQ